MFVALDVIRRQLARNLIRLGRGLGVAEVIGADVTEPRPQLDERCGRHVVADALELTAIRAGQVLPVLACGQQRVDALERLRRHRVVVERRVELVDGEVLIVDLVARDHGRGVVEARAAALRRVFEARQLIERLDRTAPLALLGKRLEQLVEQHARGGRS